MELHVDMSLGELATHRAAASRIFHREGLDYCCGGKRSLSEACEKKGLDPGELLQELDRASTAKNPASWAERPLPELIAHILQQYHEPLRRELPELIELSTKVEERHAEKARCPKGLSAHLKRIRIEVLEHLDKEEQVLFPLILAGHGSMAAAPITMMEREHEEHGDNLLRTRVITGDFQVPEEACVSWRALYLRLHELERELMEHIHLENNVLFPRALCA